MTDQHLFWVAFGLMTLAWLVALTDSMALRAKARAVQQSTARLTQMDYARMRRAERQVRAARMLAENWRGRGSLMSTVRAADELERALRHAAAGPQTPEEARAFGSPQNSA